MADEVFKPKQRPKINLEEVSAFAEDSPMDKVQQIQQEIHEQMGDDSEFEPMTRSSGPRPDAPFSIGGNIPPEFRKMMEGKGRPINAGPPRRSQPAAELKGGSDALEDLLKQLTNFNQFEEIELPSKGKFYDGSIPGVLHIRPMTGEEEQILAQQRYVKKGIAIDMIFEKCLKERINTEQLLAVDRTYLLIYLRGISYTHEYDVEIKCPECAAKFNLSIDLNELDVDSCPTEFGPEQLTGKLPTSGFRFKYRLPTGGDEQIIAKHREVQLKEFGAQNEDDTLIFRTAILLDYIEGVSDRHELTHLLKKLPINDVSHLRNTISAPPFGVDTEIGVICPHCPGEFEIDLPLEANFFFPRKKTEQTPQ